jgi:DNA helicase-2/ATP-dependent DNA helicase PcrA
MLTVKLFQSNAKILEKYQNIFRYVLVDEYQDTNHAQYMLLKLLAERHRNLFVVGDDAQSIYGFRGSNIGNILSFEKDYPDSVVVKLEQNYRSTKYILHVADSVSNLSRIYCAWFVS